MFIWPYFPKLANLIIELIRHPFGETRQNALLIRKISLMKESQITAAYLRGLIDYLHSKKIPTDVFLRKHGISEDQVSNFLFRLPILKFAQLLNEAEGLTGDNDIGLHVGENIKPSQYGVLGLSVMNCRSFGEAVQRHMRYENLVSNVGHCEYTILGNEVTLTWCTDANETSRHIAEENVSSWITFARWISGSSISPTSIFFQHDAPLSITEHQRIFRCAITFCSPNIAIKFPAHYLQLPLRQHDPDMLAMLDDYAEKLLVKLEGDNNIVQKIKTIISEHLQNNDMTLRKVASTLGMSERNLQRKLKEHQCNYQMLVDDTRKTIALKLILNKALDFAEITYLLGFSDQSTFHKSFKKWTGLTPGAYRSTR